MTDTRRLTDAEIGMYKAIQELKRRIAELESGECIWTEEIETSTWVTSCGVPFNLWGPTPAEADINFCPNCGKRIKEIPLSQEVEDD